MTTLSDLLHLPTKDEVLDFLVGIARGAGFPVASWQSGSVPRTLYEGESAMLSDLAAGIVAVAKGGYLDFAEGAWLDLLAESVFSETRKPSGFTQGTVRLTAGTGIGPYTITAGQYWVTNAAGTRRYVVVALPNGNTVPLGGSLDVTVQAESPGALYNVAPETLTTQVTPLPGVAITNPVLPAGTWITQQGTDEESDAAYRQRCRDKWGILGSGSNEAAYRYWATASSSEVTRVRVDASTATGEVTVLVAGPSGPISAPAFDTIAATLEAKRPLGVKVTAGNVEGATIPVAAHLYLSAGATALAALDTAAAVTDAYAREVKVGGSVYTSRLIAALQSAPGVSHVALSSPTGDVTVAANRVPVFLYALTASS